MASAETETRMRSFYAAITAGDLQAMQAMVADDVAFHIIRPQPAVDLTGKPEMFAYVAEAASTSPGASDVALERLGSDGDWAMCVHVEAAGTDNEHRHVMIFRWEDATIAEIWELTLGDHIG